MTRSGERARFVVHEHHARSLHWDLRLEHEGVLASWAVPKGVPEEHGVKRLAVQVEDHPLSYIAFRGRIPFGYGKGKVLIWDEGTYDCHKWEEDKIVVTFHGERLRGSYAIFRIGEGDRDWLVQRTAEDR